MTVADIYHDDLSDLVPALERMEREQIPTCDRPQGRQVFGLPAWCPRCDGPLTLVNTTASDLLAVGIFVCDDCNHEYETTVRMTPRGKRH